MMATATAALTLATSAGLAACTDDPGSKADFCEQVAKVPSLESVLDRFNETDPEVLDERIANAREAYAELASAAPSAIDSETDSVVALVNDVLDAVEANPDDPAKAAEQLREAMDTHEDIDAAQVAVTAYALDECGIRLDATLGDETEPDAGSPPSTTVPTTTSTVVTSTTAG